MKTFIRLVVLLAIGAVWFLFDGPKQSTPPSAPSRQQSAPPQQQPEVQPPKVSVSAGPWPPASEEETTIDPYPLRKNFYVIFDGSGSMNDQQCYGSGSKINVAKYALTSFAQLVPEDANLGLAIFSHNTIEEHVRLGTGNRDAFTSAVNSAAASGGTPLHSAIQTGYEKLTDQAIKQLGYGEYTLVVMTDGLASKGEDPTGIVRSILGRTPIEIHTLGFCIGENHSLNMPGRTVYKAANSQADLERGLEEVLAESETFDVSDFSK